ncbi:hypothetical protein AVEN_19291-1 [Araneus ventricosus]|uniref:Uncharacterized protein n=1 Tax=Araneus ventricosus TaxID=182803 RepID=A0A4Y2RCN4_ARAVE|nr:hypothetical protein AVEN_19291-1 [Araneus ventricosus]
MSCRQWRTGKVASLPHGKWAPLTLVVRSLLKRSEKRAAVEPLSILKVSSSQQKIFPKAQQIKSLLPLSCWTVSNPLGGH